GMLLAGDAIEEVDEHGHPITGDSLLILLNAHDDKVPFTLPPLDETQHQWLRLLDTTDPRAAEELHKGGASYPLPGPSVVVLRMPPPVRERRRSSDAATRPAAEPTEAPAPAEPVTATQA